jgi:HEAT repeat protein
MALLQQHPPVAGWLEALSHDSPFECGLKTSLGGRTVPPLSAVPSLFSLLKDSDRGIRVQAATALGNLGELVRRILPMLRAALREIALEDVDESVRTLAVHAILQVGPQPATEVCSLINSLQDNIKLVRFHAAVALGNLGCGARPAVPALIHSALRDDDPAVRLEAAMALWKIDRKGPLVIPALIRALADDNELICWIAADCLGQIGPEAREAVPALQQALRRPFKIGLIGKGVALALQRIDPQATAKAGLPSS